MRTLDLMIGFVNDVLFVGLAVVAVRQWRAHRDNASAWVAITFTILATVVIAVVVMPALEVVVTDTAMLWSSKLLIVLLLVFPYALLQFSASFEASRRPFHRVASVLLAAVIVATLLLPALPEGRSLRTGWYWPYLVLVLSYWSALSAYVSVRLWRGGAGRPTVPRRRMRVLAAGATALNVGLFLAVVSPAGLQPDSAAVAAGLLATASAVLFAFGFAPPRIVRIVWRRFEEAQLQAAQLKLMAATTSTDVMDLLLPHATAVLGARASAFFDEAGGVAASHAATAEWVSEHLTDPRIVRMPLSVGELVVWTTPHNPYFGREELDLLARLAVVADLALQRCALLDAQQEITARLEEAQSLAHLGSWRWDVASGEMTWTQEMARLLGVDPPIPPRGGDAYLAFVHPDDRSRLVEAVRRAVANNDRFSLDYRVRLADGAVRTLHTQGRAEIGSDGRPIQIIGTAHDVTERKMTEEALAAAFKSEQHARMAFERANAELESFVYSVSHDLRSPIVSLLGYLDYLKLDFGEQLPAQARQYIERMNSSASYMQALIQDLLELSRIGRVQTETSNVRLTTLLHEIRDELLPAYPKADVHIEKLPIVCMNPLRARQLFTNLLNNALLHGGRPDIHVRVDAERVNNDYMAITVDDDGVGIPAAYRDRVFGVFERLEASARSTAGTGIGLAICRKVMEHLGGSIAIVDVAEGTRVQLLFPARAIVDMHQHSSAGSASR